MAGVSFAFWSRPNTIPLAALKNSTWYVSLPVPPSGGFTTCQFLPPLVVASSEMARPTTKIVLRRGVAMLAT